MSDVTLSELISDLSLQAAAHDRTEESLTLGLSPEPGPHLLPIAFSQTRLWMSFAMRGSTVIHEYIMALHTSYSRFIGSQGRALDMLSWEVNK